MKNENEQPWLDKNGKVLSDEVLRIISKVWDQETWDRYLDFYVNDIEDSRTTYKDDSTLENLLNHSVEPTFLTGGEYVNPILKSQLSEAIKLLSDRQKFVIENIFLNNLSEHQVAELLGISRATVRGHKQTALRHLKNNLEVHPPTSTLVKGQKKLRPQRRKKDEEVEL